jgi:pyranose oxidase
MNTDVLIIGSGPVGATYARIISQSKPETKILMIDLGPQVSDKVGQHLKNISNQQDVEKAQILSQANKKEAYPMISVAERAASVNRGELNPDILARAGTHLIIDDLEEIKTNEMPALSLSSNVGGMGIHWTCACPSPGNEERIPFLSKNEFDDVLVKANEILHVSQDTFPSTPQSEIILKILNQTLGTNHSESRQAQPMPLACKTDDEGNRYWTATDVILGETLNNPNFELRSNTICRELLNENNKVNGAVIENFSSGKKETVKAKIVIVAADPIRTPQLLWASGIRPKALGHYLNEHPFIFTFVELDKELVKNTAETPHIRKSPDPLTGVFWVPFDAPNHSFHGQIMHMDLSPMKTTVSDESKHIVGLGWGCLKESNFDDQIVFSENEKDYFGMPKMTFKYKYTEKDLASIESAKQFQAKVVASFGKEIKEGNQTLMPAGTSLHYEGTTRMGIENDGESVCDTYSKVWDFENLYVGGNGVIPVSTTSNPTLTSVALAVRSAEKIVEKL